MKITCFLSVLFVHLLSIANGQEKISVTAKYVIDNNSSWHINNIKSQEFTPFGIDQQLDLGYNKNASVWCCFIIKNNNKLNHTSTYLSFDNYHIDSLLMYEGSTLLKTLGDRTTFQSPFISMLALPVDLHPREERTFYVKIKKSISVLQFSYQIVEGEVLSRKSDLKIAVISFFLGIVFLLILFNSLLHIITKKRLFLYYIMYSILSIAYIIVSTSYAKQLLFPEFLYYSECRIYISCFWLIALCAFLSNYLNLRKFEPLKYRVIVAVNTLNVCLMLLTIALLSFGKLDALKAPMLLGYFNFLVALLLISWSTVLHLKINRPKAIYILIAFLPQLAWGLGTILKFFSLIHSDIHTDWLVYICLYEVLLFGYVLTKNYMDAFQRNKKLIKEIIFEKEKSLQAITQVQIRERRSIANIIHDNFGSKLAYILQMIQLENIGIAEENIKVLANDIREISHRILPKSLDEGALISSLNSQVLSLNTGLSGAKIDLFTYDFPKKIEVVWIYDLYLIALEIINNALKHGNAKSIIIELYGYPDAYVFQFTDDGSGFDLALVAKGFGLENIEKRVKYYKGEFEINSTPGEGTIIQITIPV